MGFFGYDCVRAVEPLGEPNPDPVGLPDLALMLSDVLVAFDHLKHTVTILANAYLEEDDAHERALRADRRGARAPGRAAAAPARHPERPEPTFEPNMPREDFEAMVARIVEYVHAGDAFQVVPSQRWSAPSPVEAFSIYRGLRAVNPSPYMYFLDFEDFQIVGASPEPLLTVEGRRASTRPIAGTRPRGADVEEDRAIAAELLADEKERAEHVMLVDLGRNDLGRVCEYGSVRGRVLHGRRDLLARHAHRLLRGRRAARGGQRDRRPALAAARRARSRARRRCARCRSSTSSSRSSAAPTAAPSASCPTRATSTPASASAPSSSRTGIAHVQAGGGTVADAQPAYEYEESRAKARGVVRAIELASRQSAWP